MAGEEMQKEWTFCELFPISPYHPGHPLAVFSADSIILESMEKVLINSLVFNQPG